MYITWITTDNVQRAVTPKADNSGLRFLRFANIHLHKVSRKYLEHFSSTEWTQIYYRNHYFQSSKGHTPKVGLLELCFLCSAPRLMMLYIFVDFHKKYLEQFSTYRADTRRNGL